MTARKRKYHIKIPHKDDQLDITYSCKCSTGVKCGTCGIAWSTHTKVFISADPSDKWIYATSKKNPKIHILSLQ